MMTMSVVFKSCLSDTKSDIFDLNQRMADLPTAPLPRIGDHISFWFERTFAGRSERVCYALEVIAVVHNYSSRLIEIELGMSAYMKRTMTAKSWSEWLKRLRSGETPNPSVFSESNSP